jgi:hypothetical protein
MRSSSVSVDNRDRRNGGGVVTLGNVARRASGVIWYENVWRSEELMKAWAARGASDSSIVA